MATTKPKIDSEPEPLYAIVELMGHSQIVGKVTEIQLAGKGFLRIDVLNPDKDTVFTRMINPDSVYAINPITLRACLAYVAQHEQTPVVPYDIHPEVLRLIMLNRHEPGNEYDDEPFGLECEYNFGAPV